MLDKILDEGAGFDWIGPLAHILGNAVRGPSHTFGISYAGCPMTGRDIQLMLKKNGIKSWGLLVVDGTLMISVKKSDAPRAQQLMQAQGVTIENAAAPSKPQPRNAVRESGSPFSVFDVFD